MQYACMPGGPNPFPPAAWSTVCFPFISTYTPPPEENLMNPPLTWLAAESKCLARICYIPVTSGSGGKGTQPLQPIASGRYDQEVMGASAEDATCLERAGGHWREKAEIHIFSSLVPSIHVCPSVHELSMTGDCRGRESGGSTK